MNTLTVTVNDNGAVSQGRIEFIAIDGTANGGTIMVSAETGDSSVLMPKTKGRALERDRFSVLADWWREATELFSSPSDIADHAAYQRIIAMGPAVVPFILEDLRDRGGKWYMALRSLVPDPPVIDSSAAGSAKRVRQLWLNWGREHGYLD